MKQTLIVFLSIFFACNTTEPPPHQSTISLSVEDASCTEVWLKASTAETPVTIALLRDDQRVQTLRLLTSDSLLVDEGLLPNQAYSYQMQKLGADSTVIEASARAQVTTMDTTSHNFTWHIDTLGVTSSVLNDVAIISDSSVWTVGELYLNDTSGVLDPIRYNAAHWNGTSWTVLRVPYYYQGQPFYNPIQTVFAFGPNDVWFAGNGVIHWNGQQYVPMDISSVWGPNQINKIWGSSSNDLHIVGNGGSIAHYSSGTWQHIESGTTLPIWGIFGARDKEGGNYEVICVASNHSYPEGRKLLRIQGATVTSLPDSGLPWSIDASWYVPGCKYFVVGDSVWNLYRPGNIWTSVRGLPNLYTTSIDGSDLNDVVIGGAFLLMAHYNGISWRTYFPIISGALGAVHMKDHMVIAVGVLGNGIDDRAIIIRGTR